MATRDANKLMNYTTEVDPVKTVGEIIALLATKGAQSIMIDYKDGQPAAIAFKLEKVLGGIDMSFRLPCNIEGALAAMRRLAIPGRYLNLDQAKRTAWRIVKVWVEAQMALVECGQAQIAEVFLPHAINANGKTLFQAIQENPRRLLGAGPSSDSDNVIEGRFATGE